MTKIEFLESARLIHGYKYFYLELNNKLRLSDKISIEYNGNTYSQTISKHLDGRCPEKVTKKKTTSEFISEAIIIWGSKYDYSLVDYNGALNSVKIIYNGVIYEQRAKSHLNGLAPEFRKTKESIFDTKLDKFKLIGLCKIKDFLNKYNISYKEDYVIESLMFDVYLIDIGYIIEYKPLYHYEPISEIGYDEYFGICSVDKIKIEYCDDNYINLINIKYSEIDDIYQILWQSLKIFIK